MLREQWSIVQCLWVCTAALEWTVDKDSNADQQR